MTRHSTTLKELSGFWMEVRLKGRKVDGGRTGLSLTHNLGERRPAWVQVVSKPRAGCVRVRATGSAAMPGFSFYS